ncbi:MAG TPA: TIGR01777 family oxidoreductase [Puia sp.]|nr:TIGR01777 family oxidoreductase [Puia sp.]
MSTILITGGTGLIGSALAVKLIAEGHHVVTLTRKKGKVEQRLAGLCEEAIWDINSRQVDEVAIAKADYIIHLAGAGISEKRWTDKRKKIIRDSRIKSSELIAHALHVIPNKIRAVVSASAVGWYGPDIASSAGKSFNETAAPGNDFLGETCRLWEQSIGEVARQGTRLVIVRTGIVLDNKGGALPEFRKSLKLGIAAILGSGKQMISWIHIDDLCRIYLKAIDDENMIGTFNAVAPAPVSNRSLTLELARRVRGPNFLAVHVPAFALRIIFGEMSIEVLKSCSVSAEKIMAKGFRFLYPDIESALNALLRRPRGSGSARDE